MVAKKTFPTIDPDTVKTMTIDPGICRGCRECEPVCTTGALKWDEERLVCFIDDEVCVNCFNCYRNAPCRGGVAIIPPNVDIMDKKTRLSMDLSNPLTEHPLTLMAGRGTEECKTNEITGRIRYGYAAVAVELGRPSITTDMREVQKISTALARLGYVTFADENPVTGLMKDKKTGELQEWCLDTRALSAIIEIGIPEDRLEETLTTIRKVCDEELETVASVSCMQMVVQPGDKIPAIEIIEKLRLPHRPNGKTCIGLGRPLNNPLPFDPSYARATLEGVN
jgi:ferredoxin